jgi:C-terminal processing protease CtpA/Prc
MSGIEVMARVPDQPDYMISRVQDDSPAAEAGVCVGDRIISINNTRAADLTLDKIYKFLTGPEGKKIRMQLIREEEKIKLIFSLKKII